MNEVPNANDDPKMKARWAAYHKSVDILFETNAQTFRDLGLFALKTLILLNGGAVIGILTFLGHIYQSAKPFDDDTLAGFGVALGWLLSGIFFDMLAVLFGWLSALVAAEDIPGTIINEDLEQTAIIEEKMARLRTVAVIGTVFSFACFAVGCYQALDSFAPKSVAPKVLSATARQMQACETIGHGTEEEFGGLGPGAGFDDRLAHQLDFGEVFAHPPAP